MYVGDLLTDILPVRACIWKLVKSWTETPPDTMGQKTTSTEERGQIVAILAQSTLAVVVMCRYLREYAPLLGGVSDYVQGQHEKPCAFAIYNIFSLSVL